MKHNTVESVLLNRPEFRLKATGSRKNLRENNFYPLVADLLAMQEVQQLKDFRHHVMTTRFQHSLNVSYYNYLICRFFRLDAVSAARAGLLHDLYFYDTKQFTQTKKPIRHSQYHPMVALDNAQRLLPVNDRERDMIVKHMWPMTLQKPSYAETYILTFVDKYCALLEFFLPQPARLCHWAMRRFSHKVK
jgi:uncharacterized protein